MSEKLIYDTGILYDQHMSEKDQKSLMDFYHELFAGYQIKTIHDCSIGAGGSTLPLCKLGYTVTGSDLNENLLSHAKINFEANGYKTRLFISDFREFDKSIPVKIDCVISTGNSLPHVDFNGFQEFLRAAGTVLNDKGYLFFDIRNWDSLAGEHPLMHASDPQVMTAHEHRSLYLIFNWHDNGSVSFVFATCVDKNGKHDRISFIEAPAYYPLLRKDIEAGLSKAGFQVIRYVDMDSLWLAAGMESDKTGNIDEDFPAIQWYGVLAKKI